MKTSSPPGARLVDAADLMRIRWPLEPQLRPDGGAVAYVVSGLDPSIDALSYELRVCTLADGADRRIVAGSGARSPRWSHDGRSLAYLSTVDSLTSLVVTDATTTGSGGDAAKALAGGAVDIIDFAWAPDDVCLAVLASHPTETDGLCALTTVTTDAATDTVVHLHEPRLLRWSPDGRRLAIVCGNDGLDGTPLELSVVLVDLMSSSTRQVLSWHGPIKNLAWASDGLSIALIGHDRGPAGWENDGIWILADDGGCVELTAGHDLSFGRVVRGDDERGLGAPVLHWLTDGSGIVTTVVRRGRSSAVLVTMGGRVEELLGGDRAILELSVSSSGTFVVSWSDPFTPGELSIIAAGSERVITDINAQWRSEVALASTVELSAVDPNGPEVDGWLTVPGTSAAPSPVVMQVHGGPHYSVGMRFSFDAQRLAALGIAVLRGNPRGSGGSGQEFAEALRGDWGGLDLGDVLALIEMAAARPDVDGHRVAIMGESYGGFLTNWAIATTDRFVAAIAENSITDPLALALGPRGPNFWWVEFDASPRDHPERFTARSALAAAESITTPLLLIHAEDDDNCLIGQSESMYEALDRLGRPVEMVTIPDEGHFVNVFGRASRRLRRTAEIDRFLCTHLLAPARERPS